MIGIIQFRKDQSLAHEQKCFNEHLSNEVLKFYSVFDESVDFEHPAELLKQFDKLILAGSGEFLISGGDSDTKYLQKRIEPLLRMVIEQDFPTFGICFGFQLLGTMDNGEVTRDASQGEAGIREVVFNTAGRADPLFFGLSEPIMVATGHEDSVTKMPKGAIHLALNENCKNQAFRIGKNVYGVQFHPELDDNDLYERLNIYSQYDEFQLGRDVPEIVHGPQVLYNFSKL